MKDDSGAYAVFTEQSSSVSKMTATQIMEFIARLPDCDGQAADAVSAYTEDAPKLLRTPKSECPDRWIRNPRHRWPKSWSNIGKSCGSSGTKFVRTSTCWTTVGDSWKNMLELEWEKVPNGECRFVHRQQGLFLSLYVNDINMAGKKRNTAPMRKKLLKSVDLDKHTSFFDHVYLGCTQRQCEPNESTVEQYKEMFESRISARATEKVLGWDKDHAKQQRGPTTWTDMPKSAWKEIANWQTRSQSNCTKFQVLAWVINMSRRRNLNQLENGHTFAHKLY